jgi:hypothetical protein
MTRLARSGRGLAPVALACVGLAVGLSLAAPTGVAAARPSDPGVVNYAVLPDPDVLRRQPGVQQLG